MWRLARFWKFMWQTVRAAGDEREWSDHEKSGSAKCVALWPRLASWQESWRSLLFFQSAPECQLALWTEVAVGFMAYGQEIETAGGGTASRGFV